MANFTDTQNFDQAETMNGFSGGQTILGRYRLNRVLGQGGMGVVWLARDEKLERDVALKFLPDIVVNDRASLNDLIRETRRSLELTHPHIVRTYDFVQDNSIAGISMEYVDSDTLRNLRIDQPNGVFETSQVGEWVGQLCSALQYAHAQASIVHRDLKPANLMINGRSQLKVADFGIARSLVESVSQMTLKGGTSGTLVYMSPQQLSGDQASALDDIYSLGATLYELFTTKPPFYSGDISGQVRTKIAPSVAQRRTSLSIPVGDFPSNWEETIAACLAKEPAQRPQSAAEVAVRLGLLDAASLPAVSTVRPAAVSATAAPNPYAPATVTATLPAYSTATATEVIAPPAPSRRNLLIAAGALALLLALVVAGVMMNNNHKQELARQEQVRQEQDRREKARLEAEHLANARGSLIIKTEPAGAMVKVGDHAPVPSPASFGDLKLGKQTCEVALDGYDPVTLTAQIEENKIAEMPIVALVPSKGALQIHSQPEGLTYELRSRANPMSPVRGVTPFTASALPVGDYDVTVIRDGWPSEKQTVQVRHGQEENKMFEFPNGSVTLTSDPAGAKVMLNGKDTNLVTPTQVDDLPPGPVKYTLQLEGYDSAVAAGTVTAGQVVPLQVALKKASEASHHVATTTRRSSSSGRSSGNNDSDGGHAPSWLRFIPSGGPAPSFPHPGGFPHP